MLRPLTFLAIALGFAAGLPAQNPAPANSHLSPNARRVLSYLHEQQGKVILSGQEEGPGNLSKEEEAVLAATGRRPAIRGFDVRFDNPFPAQAALAAWREQHQLITFSWHMGLPPDGPMTDAEDSYKSSQSNVDAAIYDAILTPGTKRHENLMAKLKQQADRLQLLADQDVPVLWRPLHEHEADGGKPGGWFWWSDINGDPTRFTRLWALMYDYFVNVRHLNNLIWVWSGNKDPYDSCGGTTGRQWYEPIAGQVDLLGTDVYRKSQNNEYWKLCYDHLREMAGKKPVALSEGALMPLPDDMIAGGWLFSYFLTWTGQWRNENSPERLKAIYTHPRVITADRMPDLSGKR